MTEPQNPSPFQTYVRSSAAPVTWFGRLTNYSPLSWIGLGLGLAATVMGTRLSLAHIEERTRAQFQQDVEETRLAIQEKMGSYEELLHGAAGLWSSGSGVSRATWRSYVAGLELNRLNTGVLGLVFAERVPRSRLGAHLAQVRKEGFPNYRISPAGNRPEYLPIVFIEPFSGVNLRAFGYDPLTDSVRREALERARDSGAPAVSGRIHLVQEASAQPQVGLFMAVPVYRGGQVPATVGERREKLVGFVGAPFHTGAFMRSVLAGRAAGIDVELYDGASLTADDILFNRDREMGALGARPHERFSQRSLLSVGGRTWALYAGSEPEFDEQLSGGEPWLVGTAGVVLSLLVFIVMRYEGAQRRRAQVLAERMSRERRRSRDLLDQSSELMYILEPVTGRIIDANQRAWESRGLTKAELLNLTLAEVGIALPDFAWPAHLEEVRASGRLRFETTLRRRDGSLGPIDVDISVAPGPEREYLVAVVRDITERRRFEDTLKESEARYRQLVESAPIGIYVNAEGRFVYANATAAEILGADSPAALVGTRVMDRVPADLQPIVEARMARLLRGESVPLMEQRYRRMDGSQVDVEVISIPSHFRGHPAIQVLVRDITERREAERALIESERRFRTVLEGLPLLAVSLDRDGRVRFCNDQLLELTGWRREEVIGHDWFLRFLPAEEEASRTVLRTALAGGAIPPRQQGAIVTRSGDRRLIAWSNQVSRNAEGEITGISRIGEDITEPELYAEALRRSEANLRLAQEIGRVGSWRVDLVHGRPDVWSEETYRIFGQDPANYTPTLEGFYASVHPDDLPGVRAAFERSISTGEEYQAEHRIRRRDGSERHVVGRGRIVRDDEGRPLEALGTLQDITGRRKAEIELRESRERLAGIIGSAMDAIITVDSAQNIVVFNAAAERVFRCSAAEALGRPLQRFLPGSLQPPPRPVPDRPPGAGRAPDGLGETWGLRANGERFPIEASISQLDSSGERFFTIILRDVSERQAGEITRRRLESQLRQSQKMEAIGTLAGGIAHDFNNILAAIMGNAELGIREVPEGQPGRQTFEEILLAGQRAKELVLRILAFSRQQEQERRPILLDTVVAEALKMLRATLPATIEIRAKISGGMPAVLADPTQIHQVILNLCTNAAHAIGDRPGRLEVELDVIDLSRELALDPDLVVGRHVRMSITDDGVGMDRATIERIFDPFFTTKPLGQGTGLGLAVVHGIVRSHDGAIRAYSEPGKGSKFSVYLPAIETPMGSGPSESTEAPAGHGEHVVVVDDEAMLVEVSRRLLERLGYRVTGVGSAAEALALVQADPDRVDLVLTDLTMPGMSGADLARHLAALRGDLPVILITGFGTARQAEAARRAGVREILMKPATLKSLGDAVHRALSTVESEAVRK